MRYFYLGKTYNGPNFKYRLYDSVLNTFIWTSFTDLQDYDRKEGVDLGV